MRAQLSLEFLHCLLFALPSTKNATGYPFPRKAHTHKVPSRKRENGLAQAQVVGEMFLVNRTFSIAHVKMVKKSRNESYTPKLEEDERTHTYTIYDVCGLNET